MSIEPLRVAAVLVVAVLGLLPACQRRPESLGEERLLVDRMRPGALEEPIEIRGPDGRYLGRLEERDHGEGKVLVYALSSGTSVRVTSTDDPARKTVFAVSQSEDGDKLAFYSTGPGMLGMRGEIEVVDARTGRRSVTQPGEKEFNRRTKSLFATN